MALTETLFLREVYRTLHSRTLMLRLGGYFCIICLIEIPRIEVRVDSAHLAYNNFLSGGFYKIDVFVSAVVVFYYYCFM